jgi:hypothetical protein
MSGTVSLSSISSNSPDSATVLLSWNTTIAPTTYTIFLVQTDLTNDASANCSEFFRSVSGTINTGELESSTYIYIGDLEPNTKYLASAQIRIGTGTVSQARYLQSDPELTTILITIMEKPLIHVSGKSENTVTLTVKYFGPLDTCYYAFPDKVQFYYTDGVTIQSKLFEDPYNFLENDYVIDGLTSGTTYYFSCEVANEAGFSEVSETVIETPDDTPLAPQDVSANLTDTDYGQGEITVTWSAPLPGSVTVDYYEIYDDPSGELLGTVDGEVYEFLFNESNGAILGRTYSFYVIAVSIAGVDSPRSEPSTTDILFATVPDYVFDLSANCDLSIVTVEWQPPVGDSGDNVYTYTLQYKLVTALDASYITISNATSPTELSGLTVGAEYDIRVRATNSIGNGLWEYTTVLVTAEPNPPTNLQVYPIFGSSDGTSYAELNTDPNTIYNFVLKWDPPADIEGVTIADYQVNWSYINPINSVIVSGSYTTLLNTGSSSILPRPDLLANPNNLGRGFFYTFTVQAISTDEVIGNPSAEKEARAYTRVPAIQNFTATPGNGSVQLEWNPDYSLSAYPDNTTIDLQTGWSYETDGSFQIVATPTSGGPLQTFYTSDNSYNVTGLTNGISYKFVLQPNIVFFQPLPKTNPQIGASIATESATPIAPTRSFDEAGPVFESAPIISQLYNGQYNVRVLVRSDIPMKRVVSLAVAENDSVPHQIIQKSDVNNEVAPGLYEYNFVYDFPLVGALCFATNGADLTTSSPTFPPE